MYRRRDIAAVLAIVAVLAAALIPGSGPVGAFSPPEGSIWIDRPDLETADVGDPVSLPLSIPGGGDTTWRVRGDAGTSSGPYDGDCNGSAGLGILDAFVTSTNASRQAFDFGSSVWVNGQIFKPGGTVNYSSQNRTLTSGPISIDGAQVTVQYYMAQDSSTLRTLASLTNPSESEDLTVRLSWVSNLGSDSNAIIPSGGTFNGDNTFTSGDRWAVTSWRQGKKSWEAAIGNVFFGPGPATGSNVPLKPVSVSSDVPTLLDSIPLLGLKAPINAAGDPGKVFNCSTDDGIGADFSVTIPAKASASLLFFSHLFTDDATALSQTADIYGKSADTQQPTLTDGSKMPADLLRGLPVSQLAQVKNWNFQFSKYLLTGPGEGGGSRVKSFAFSPNAADPGLRTSSTFLSHGSEMRGGARIAAGSLDFDAAIEYATAPGPTIAASAPAPVSWGVGRLDVFVKGTDDVLYQRTFDNGAWQPWAGHEGPALTSTPAAVSWGTGRLDVFVRGSDNALWHRAFSDGTWQPWGSLGNVLASDPAAVSWGAGRLDVFVKGIDNALYQRTFDNGAWQPWAGLEGALTSTPAVVSWGTGRLDVFVKGIDNALYQRTFANGAWQPWAGLEGALTSTPAAVSWGTGRLDVFVKGIDNALYQRTFNGAWQPWIGLEGGLTSTPAPVSWGTGRLDVFVKGTDNALHQRTFANGAWQPWTGLEGALTSTPAVVSWGAGRLDVFVKGIDNALYQRTFANGAWQPWAETDAGPPIVKIFEIDPKSGKETLSASFEAYPADFRGGLNLAIGSVETGTSVPEIIVAPQSGPQPVKVFKRVGSAWQQFASFSPFGSTYSGGITVASGDVEGDGRDEIIVGAGPGATPQLKIYRVGNDGLLSLLLINDALGFDPYPGYDGGINVASANLDTNSRREIVTAPAGPGAGNLVKVFKYVDSSSPLLLVLEAQGFVSGDGLSVATGDLDGTVATDPAELILGAGVGTDPSVKMWKLNTSSLPWTINREFGPYLAYNPDFKGGVFVGGIR